MGWDIKPTHELALFLHRDSAYLVAWTGVYEMESAFC
jgi:hypothetical protein